MDLTLTLTQKQVLSQKMQQSAEILQMSTLTLTEYMQELSEINPVVEWEEEGKEESLDELRRKLEWLGAKDEQNKPFYQQGWNEEQENDDWKFQRESRESLREYLLFQINILPLKEKLLQVSHYLVESIQPSGYLDEGALEAAKEEFGLQDGEAEEALEVIQGLEPKGVGARSLKECLLLQIRGKETPYPLCETIISEYLELLGKNQIPMIAKKLKVKMCEVVTAIQVIKSLNPKPGSGISSDLGTEYILPDVLVAKEGEGLQIHINKAYTPQMKINGYYKEVLQSEASHEAKEYISGKIRQAEWVMECIRKRDATLIKTMDGIVTLQKDFFSKTNGELHPMCLSDVADLAGIHESTVSRAIRDKYVQCSKGVFPLHYFFSTGIEANDEKSVSSHSVKKMMQELIQNENKKAPFSDREIAEALQERGVKASRRTVTKYREALGLPVAAERKEYED